MRREASDRVTQTPRASGGAEAPAAASQSNGLDYLDIPAFLRRQAD